jgi:hypothetical protein
VARRCDNRSVELPEVRPGLFRWTARHPEWRPGAAAGSAGDWPEEVGCVLYEAHDKTVLIDPLLPPERESFLRELEQRALATALA